MKVLEILMRMAVTAAVPAGREQELGERLQDVRVPMSFIERGDDQYTPLIAFVQKHTASEPRGKFFVQECGMWLYVCQFNPGTLKATSKALRKYLGPQNLPNALLQDC